MMAFYQSIGFAVLTALTVPVPAHAGTTEDASLLRTLNEKLLPPNAPARFVHAVALTPECGARDQYCDAIIEAKILITQPVCVDRGESDVWTWGEECVKSMIPVADISPDSSYDITGEAIWRGRYALKWLPGTYAYNSNLSVQRGADGWNFEALGVTTEYSGNITLPTDDYDWPPRQDSPSPADEQIASDSNAVESSASLEMPSTDQENTNQQHATSMVLVGRNKDCPEGTIRIDPGVITKTCHVYSAEKAEKQKQFDEEMRRRADNNAEEFEKQRKSNDEFWSNWMQSSDRLYKKSTEQLSRTLEEGLGSDEAEENDGIDAHFESFISKCEGTGILGYVMGKSDARECESLKKISDNHWAYTIFAIGGSCPAETTHIERGFGGNSTCHYYTGDEQAPWERDSVYVSSSSKCPDGTIYSEGYGLVGGTLCYYDSGVWGNISPEWEMAYSSDGICPPNTRYREDQFLRLGARTVMCYSENGVPYRGVDLSIEQKSGATQTVYTITVPSKQCPSGTAPAAKASAQGGALCEIVLPREPVTVSAHEACPAGTTRSKPFLMSKYCYFD